MHPVDAGEDELGLRVDASQVAVRVTGAVTDNPLGLLSGQRLLTRIQHLARQVVDLLLNVHGDTAHIVDDVAHTGKIDGRIVIDVQFPVFFQVFFQRFNAGQAVLGMAVDGVDLAGRKFGTHKGISWNAQDVDLAGLGIKQRIHNDVCQLLGVVHTTAQNRNGVLLERFDVVFRHIFRIDFSACPLRAAQRCSSGCSSGIACHIRNGDTCYQTDSSHNRSGDFFLQTQSFCPQTFLAFFVMRACGSLLQILVIGHAGILA